MVPLIDAAFDDTVARMKRIESAKVG